jgi:hypothetical protein
LKETPRQRFFESRSYLPQKCLKSVYILKNTIYTLAVAVNASSGGPAHAQLFFRGIELGMTVGNEPEGSFSGRMLFSIPIIHTQADMGGLGRSVEKIKILKYGREKANRSTRLVDKAWEDIEAAVESLPIASGRVRIYQDGLPVCGVERKIVSELAETGSRNHQLLLRLEERGAVLMGTESPQLLLAEYNRAAEELTGAAKPTTRTRETDTRAHSLLSERDKYIAARINKTLASGETAILFLGMLHSVEPHLDPDIRVIHPVRR